MGSTEGYFSFVRLNFENKEAMEFMIFITVPD